MPAASATRTCRDWETAGVRTRIRPAPAGATPPSAATRSHADARVPGRLREAAQDVREGTGMPDVLGGGVVALPPKDDRRRFGGARHRRGAPPRRGQPTGPHAHSMGTRHGHDRAAVPVGRLRSIRGEGGTWFRMFPAMVRPRRVPFLLSEGISAAYGSSRARYQQPGWPPASCNVYYRKW